MRAPRIAAASRRGAAPGAGGVMPRARSQPLARRRQASASEASLRQVTENDTETSGPTFTQCGAFTGA